jgi:transcription elongation factor Elf1
MTVKKQLTTALQAAQQCGVNKGVQLQAFMKGVAYARKHPDWRAVEDNTPFEDYYPNPNKFHSMPHGANNPTILIGNKRLWGRRIPMHVLHCPICFKRMEVVCMSHEKYRRFGSVLVNSRCNVEFACTRCGLTAQVPINSEYSDLQITSKYNDKTKELI